MRVLAFWSTILAALLAAVGLFLALMGFAGGKNVPLGILGVLLVLVPIAGAIWVTRKSRDQGRPAFEAAIQDAFHADKQGWYDGSGIAIDKAGGKVLLGVARGIRTVPATSISEVTYVAQRIAPASTGLMALLSIFRQIGVASHNFSQAGLYIAAAGQRTRIIGIKQGDGDKWKSLIAAAKASA